MPKPILAGIDPGRDDPAPLALTAALARATGAPVVVMAAFPWGIPASRGYVPPAEPPTEVRAALDRATDFLGGLGGLDVRTVAAPATSPARALHYAAEDVDAGLLVVGSTHRGPVGRVLPGNHTEQTLSGAPCPVAVAPHGYELPAERIARIGAAYVDTPESREALASAAALARRCHATLRVYTIVEPVSWGSDISWPAHSGPVPFTERREIAEQMLQEAIAGLPADVRADSEVVPAGTVQSLSAAAGGLDLLICGSRGYGPVRRVLLGSVSHMLVRNALCPLMVLPHGTEATLESFLDASQTASVR